MALVTLYAAPGICKVNSAYASGKTQAAIRDRAATGRYIDGDHTRFVGGFPEKIGGWVRAVATPMVDTPRAMTDWRDNDSNARMGIGTETHLYYSTGSANTDITPVRTISTGTLGADPLSTVNGSAVVSVADASQQLVNGDWVLIEGATTFNNVTIVGWYIVSNRSAGGYDITSATLASGTGAGGGVSVTFGYPRVTLTNPFATVNLSTTVTVTDATHGATTGDYVTFSGASAVGGLTLNGEYQLTVLTANTYTITAASAATSTVAAGGGSVSVIYDITVGQLGGLTGVVYGSGPYGTGAYGYTASSVPTQFSAWTLAAYGSWLLASPTGGTIYVYDPAAGGRAHEVYNAPASCLAIFVTPERFLFALGIDGNPMEIAWPDQSDITNWTTTPSNTANSGRSFQGGTFMIAGAPVANGVSLFFSNRAAFQAAYTGDNTVYSTPLVSDQAGLIGPAAVTTLGGVAFWMSPTDFWMWNGSVVPIPSDDIREYVFGDINRSYQSRCVAGTVRAFKEVWFWYPSGASTDIDRYVILHLDQGVWSIGTMDRTAWLDTDLFAQPYGCDAAGYLYSQEFGVNANGGALSASIQYAPTDISNGDRAVDLFGFIPDFERIMGTVDVELTLQLYPMSTPTTETFSVEADGSTPMIDLRSDAKMVGYQIDTNAVDGDFRLGVPRVNVQPGGARL
jgi:hypothetical protein